MKFEKTITFSLGVAHKLRLQDGIGPLFVNIYTIENVNAGGRWSKKSQNLVNVVCERALS